jgi:hypothetical protein
MARICRQCAIYFVTQSIVGYECVKLTNALRSYTFSINKLIRENLGFRVGDINWKRLLKKFSGRI